MNKIINIILGLVLLGSIGVNGYLFMNNYSRYEQTSAMQAEAINLNERAESLKAELTQKDVELETLKIQLEELADTMLDVRTEYRILEKEVSTYENAELEEFIESEK